ncbi:hypothetical protein [uncultured Legionella sp.]|uniref:hypothetical protein n=1 Tax=uncultured Legionella sp. TaxID=210934 RepID=UPI0026366835|nr:hypothetical protein [uncultured Legionella sp.]
MSKFYVETVAAFSKNKPTNNPSSIFINCPDSVLNEFRRVLSATPILGAEYNNPYTGQKETLPEDVEELTSRHLQVLARNEHLNVDGTMKVGLYNNLLTPDQIARIRCLVKATTVSGTVHATHTGGYRLVRQKFSEPIGNILIDQAGLQWQNDYRNTGGMHFYPEDVNHKALPDGYSSWQKTMYKTLYGFDRPTAPSANTLQVYWGKVKGFVDLDSVTNALALEFTQALDAVVFQGNHDLTDQKINFKFCRAGMGFFSSGLHTDSIHELRVARLKGIEKALQEIAALPESKRAEKLGKIGRLVLPHSNEAPYSDDVLRRIGILVHSLGLNWGGAPEEDPFKPEDGYVNATTNCADPHAMPGNEGGASSVDACISYNANINNHNAALNKDIQLRVTPEFIFSPMANKVLEENNAQLAEREAAPANDESLVKNEKEPISNSELSIFASKKGTQTGSAEHDSPNPPQFDKF